MPSHSSATPFNDRQISKHPDLNGPPESLLTLLARKKRKGTAIITMLVCAVLTAAPVHAAPPYSVGPDNPYLQCVISSHIDRPEGTGEEAVLAGCDKELVKLSDTLKASGLAEREIDQQIAAVVQSAQLAVGPQCILSHPAAVAALREQGLLPTP